MEVAPRQLFSEVNAVPCRQAMNLALTRLFLTILLVAGVSGQTRVPPSESAPSSVQPPSSRSTHDNNPVLRDRYVGDDACRSCHRDKVETFHRTAHYLTSQVADKDSIAGKFSPDANILKTSNPNLFFRMDVNDKGFFQTAVEGEPPYTTSRTERFDFVIGSGGKGQTYLFWKGDQLFQLPVSYWRELGQWVNSPGYRDGVANFGRPIIARCLECHASYFESLPPPDNRYSKTGFVPGIICEKCHGPGREHAQRHSSKSAPAFGAATVNPARLSRDRQIDLCAWCHAGHGAPLVPAFSATSHATEAPGGGQDAGGGFFQRCLAKNRGSTAEQKQLWRDGSTSRSEK